MKHIVKSKFNSKSKSLILGLLIGDGTICKSKYGCQMKVHQGRGMKEYTEWKVKMMDKYGVKHGDINTIYCSTNFTNGEKRESSYVWLRNHIFYDVLRRVVYTEYGKVFSRKLLNRLTSLGLAIWYMDDGSLNFKKHTLNDGTKKIHGLFLRISCCLPKHILQTYVDYFKEVWNINFYMIHEGKKQDSYSLSCGTNEAIKFINIVKPYVNQVQCMKYKVEYDLSHRSRRPIDCTHENVEVHSITNSNEDIVQEINVIH